MKFQFEVPKEVADACRFLATQPDFFSQSPRNIIITLIMQAEKKFRQDIFAASKKISVPPIQEVTKNPLETNSIPAQPVLAPYDPVRQVAFDAEMEELLGETTSKRSIC